MRSSDVKLNIKQIISDITADLKPRQKEVIAKRFGLDDGERRTLEAIGNEFGVTRERIRQIEEQALIHLKKPKIISYLSPVFVVLASHIDDYGHLRREDTIFYEDSSDLFPHKNFSSKAAVHFVLTLGKPFSRFGETEKHHSFWTTKKPVASSVKSSLDRVVRRINKIGRPISKNDLIQILKSEFSSNHTEKIFHSYLDISKEIASNIYGEYGIAHWPDISPKGVRDKAFLVFNKINKPLHFLEVAEMIQESGFERQYNNPQTIHNELIKDDRFVLVGRGIYALKDWGYTAGTVSDVITHILKEAKGPLSKKEIIENILNQREVKSNTIVLNLQNRDKFRRTENDKYCLN